jgi:hypothetical protein
MSAVGPTLAAVVLPARGGAHLARALAALDWADARGVLALDGVDVAVPGGVAVVGPHALASTGAAWVLLLAEEERLDPSAPAAIRAALASAGAADAFALPCVTTALDLRARLARRVVRLAPSRARIGMRPDLDVELAGVSVRVRELDVAIVRSRGTTLSDAVDLLAAEAGTLAALIELGVGRGRGIVWQPLVAGTRALTARAAGGPLGLGRWVLAVLEGYRVVAAHAKVWERRRARAVAVAG